MRRREVGLAPLSADRADPTTDLCGSTAVPRSTPDRSHTIGRTRSVSRDELMCGRRSRVLPSVLFPTTAVLPPSRRPTVSIDSFELAHDRCLPDSWVSLSRIVLCLLWTFLIYFFFSTVA